MKEKIIAAIKSMLSEKDGSVSTSRCLASASVTSVLTWVSYVTFKNGVLPDLTGASLFLTAGFSGYAANQFTRWHDHDGGDDKGKQ
jgi:hypothetical protein